MIEFEKSMAKKEEVEESLDVAQQKLLDIANVDFFGRERIGAVHWRYRIIRYFDQIRGCLPALIDPAIGHEVSMTNLYYRCGFELHAEGVDRNDSPYPEGWWTDLFQSG